MRRRLCPASKSAPSTRIHPAPDEAGFLPSRAIAHKRPAHGTAREAPVEVCPVTQSLPPMICPSVGCSSRRSASATSRATAVGRRRALRVAVDRRRPGGDVRRQASARQPWRTPHRQTRRPRPGRCPSRSRQLERHRDSPWGLFARRRAPDHPEMKLVTRVFEAIAARTRVPIIRQAEIGRDSPTLPSSPNGTTRPSSRRDRRDPHMPVPANELPGCWCSSELVAWYQRPVPTSAVLHFDLSGERAVIVRDGSFAT